MKFPDHKELLLRHNPHNINHQSAFGVQEEEQHYLLMNSLSPADIWVSPEQREKAFKTNELWTLQWYPENTVSHYYLWAADLDVLLTEAMKVAYEEVD